MRWLRFGGRAALVLAALLGLGALLVVGNTVRLDIQSRREEIGVLQLLGPPTASCAARSCTWAPGTGWLPGRWRWRCWRWPARACAAPLAELAAQLWQPFRPAGLRPAAAPPCVLAAPAVLGWLGAGLVTGHYLRQTRPTRAT